MNIYLEKFKNKKLNLNEIWNLDNDLLSNIANLKTNDQKLRTIVSILFFDNKFLTKNDMFFISSHYE